MSFSVLENNLNKQELLTLTEYFKNSNMFDELLICITKFFEMSNNVLINVSYEEYYIFYNSITYFINYKINNIFNIEQLYKKEQILNKSLSGYLREIKINSIEELNKTLEDLISLIKQKVISNYIFDYKNYLISLSELTSVKNLVNNIDNKENIDENLSNSKIYKNYYSKNIHIGKLFLLTNMILSECLYSIIITSKLNILNNDENFSNNFNSLDDKHKEIAANELFDDINISNKKELNVYLENAILIANKELENYNYLYLLCVLLKANYYSEILKDTKLAYNYLSNEYNLISNLKYDDITIDYSDKNKESNINYLIKKEEELLLNNNVINSIKKKIYYLEKL